jgi:hypothetical protein
LQGRREIFSHVSSSIWSEYSRIEKSLPHAVQRMLTVRQPIRSSTSLPQDLQFIETSREQETGASTQESGEKESYNQEESSPGF